MSKQRHAYQEHEKGALWRALDRGVGALVKNGDLKEQTARRYIVGYLNKLLDEEGFEQVRQLHEGQQIFRVVEVTNSPRLKVAS